jgi:hydroxymethylpyrimidine kinase/phosphomethylpyrimidine kinase
MISAPMRSKVACLDSVEIISGVAEEIAWGRQRSGRELPFVLDPVMVAKGGSRLLRAEAENALKAELMPLATLITPNIPEAEVLTDRRITCVDDMVGAGKWLNEQGAHSVLVKGGHLEGGSPDGCSRDGGWTGQFFFGPEDRNASHPWNRMHIIQRDCHPSGAGHAVGGSCSCVTSLFATRY